MKNSFNITTPVVFIIFNRPDKVKAVFERIRMAKPQKLFIIADGPRKNIATDIEKCKLCRKIVENIDWDCNVYRNYSDKNLGCGIRPASGLDWVFSQVEEAIILEDDCLPDISFFYFCQELLEKYKNDERIISISGNNFQDYTVCKESYYFSYFTLTCGWATWKRVWDKYDYNMALWPEFKKRKYIYNLFKNKKFAKSVFVDVFDDVYSKKITSVWDYQFSFLSFCNHGLNIVPKVNLVKNIGFDEYATHTFESKSTMAYKMSRLEKMTFPLVHPTIFQKNIEAEHFDMKYAYCYYSIYERVINKIKKIFLL